VIISSGCGRLFVIIGPPFPKHSAGPVQMGRLIGHLEFYGWSNKYHYDA